MRGEGLALLQSAPIIQIIQCTNGVTEVWGPPRRAPCGDSQQQGQGLSECFGDVLGGLLQRL